MYALVEIKGKQYKAEQGRLIKVDAFQEESGQSLEFDSILLTSDGETVKVGAPYVAGAKVKATIENHKKDKKIMVIKFKRRKGYRRRQGHRQQYSYLRVNEILGA